MKYPAIIMSISQISETLFILAIPFFLRRFGIKQVMLFSMIAWVLRFGLFAYGNPGQGLWMIILSCIVYGMAFDFFNISGSLFVETQTQPSIRASAAVTRAVSSRYLHRAPMLAAAEARSSSGLPSRCNALAQSRVSATPGGFSSSS